jgi:hypothetical protein
MSSAYEAQIKELRRQALDLEDGPTEVSLLEEAVRLADTHQRIDLGFSVRKDLIRAATFGGSPEKALVHFSWRLAQSDRDPERFSEQDLLWEYKWIVDSLVDFPHITRQQIEDALADMTRRYRRLGLSLRSVYKLQSSIAADMGELAEARRAQRLWEKTPRDGSSDCLACDQNHRVYHHVSVGKFDRAVEAAGPILSGRMNCHVVPHSTLGRVLYPLLRLGRVEEAMAAHVRGYRLIRDNPEFLARIGNHVQFLAWTDNLSRAVKLFENHLSWALSTRDEAARFTFFLAARFLFERLQAVGRPSLRMRLPRAFGEYQESGRYETAAVRRWLHEACTDLAARFDARDGNNAYARQLKYAERMWKRWVVPHPLGSKA